ncbi:DNA repair protein RadA [Vallitaleaceae bacterium 9-2]
MAKNKSIFVCGECGYEASKWMGKCPECNSWNSMAEEVKVKVSSTPKKVSGQLHYEKAKPLKLSEIQSEVEERMETGIKELDRVLGGGIVQGSLVLVGGDPGIGKSTMMLQICQAVSRIKKKVLYISGEESLHQIKMRGKRLGVANDELLLYAQTNMNIIESVIMKEQPDVLMIDSIQTMYNEDIGSVPGSVSQVREVTAHLMRLAKQLNIATFIVGHVTKDGAIAGPRVLEHMVDTVLYFEGDKNASYRVLRGVKNRFGSTNELGIFEMRNEGLVEVLNPSEYMLSGRPINEPGSLVVCAMEGSRPLFVEVQALVSYTTFNMPRRTVNGADYNRIMMLLAVIEKKYGLSLVDNDCYVNIAGGLKMNEPSLDLGIIAAVISSIKNQAIDPQTVLMGEVGLTGEVRGITFSESRVKEAVKLGFKTIVLPWNNAKAIKTTEDIQIIGIKHINDLKQHIF